MKTFNILNDTKAFLDSIAPIVTERVGRKRFDTIDAEENGIYWDEVSSFMCELQYLGMGVLGLYSDAHAAYFEFNNEVFDNTYFYKDGKDQKYNYKF